MINKLFLGVDMALSMIDLDIRSQQYKRYFIKIWWVYMVSK